MSIHCTADGKCFCLSGSIFFLSAIHFQMKIRGNLNYGFFDHASSHMSEYCNFGTLNYDKFQGEKKHNSR